MPRASVAISDAYVGRLRRFDRARAKTEALVLSGHLTRRDAELFYEGIFLRTVTTFEGLMEDLFVGLLAGSITPGRNVHPRVTFKSHAVAKDVMLGGRTYVDWLPYHHAEKRAEAFFRGGHPFCRLDNADKKDLERILTIRHAVAHQSASAKANFERRVIGATPLLPRDRTPAGYLRAIFKTAPDQTHYEDIANTCALLARKMCS